MPISELSSANQPGEPTIVLSERDAREAARLLRVLTQAFDDQPSSFECGDDLSRDDLILRARIVLNSRRHRSHFFNPAMFGEPAWDMLLVLYVTERSEGRQSIGRLAEWIETPLTTAIRWIDYLEKERLVKREPHPNDKRVMFIRLSDKGRELLDSYLSGTPWEPQEID